MMVLLLGVFEVDVVRLNETGEKGLGFDDMVEKEDEEKKEEVENKRQSGF